jgi:hypothetical protein
VQSVILDPQTVTRLQSKTDLEQPSFRNFRAETEHIQQPGYSTDLVIHQFLKIQKGLTYTTLWPLPATPNLFVLVIKLEVTNDDYCVAISHMKKVTLVELMVTVSIVGILHLFMFPPRTR